MYIDEHSRKNILYHQQIQKKKKKARNQISGRGEESFHKSTQDTCTTFVTCLSPDLRGKIHLRAAGNEDFCI